MLLPACASAPPAAPPPPPIPAGAALSVDAYFPLAPQSQWTYRVQDFAKMWTYQNRVRVHGPRFMDLLGRDGVEVEESYSSSSGPYYVEEQEPMLYYRDNGYLHRIFLARQAGKLVPASGSGDTRLLPEVLAEGKAWDSDTIAFRVGGDASGDLGFRVIHHHVIVVERDAVRVPAGTFANCVRVDTFSTHGPGSGAKPGEEISFFYSDWYAPGIGLVRTQQWDDRERSRERTRIELLSYRLGPPAGQGAAATGAN